MPFYFWNKQTNKWEIYSCSTKPHIISTIKLITFNVLCDNYTDSFFDKIYNNNIVFSSERYTDTLQKLSKENADIITLNEVTNSFLTMIMKCSWIQNDYFISEAINSTDNNIYPFGNLILTKIPPLNCVIFKVEALKRAIVTGIFCVKHNDKEIKFSVSAAHLTARAQNHDRRHTQLAELADKIKKLSLDYLLNLSIIQGDLNFHSEDENNSIKTIGYHDGWQHLHDINTNPGYTFDSINNNLIQKLYLGFEKRRMRLDRVLMSSTDALKLTEIKVILNNPIYKTKMHSERHLIYRLINAILSLIFSILSCNFFRNKQKYLYNSDHFGILSKLELVSGH